MNSLASSTERKIKIVVTGGPSGGKTTLIDALQKEFGNKIAVCSEAASILYKGGFPRKKSKFGQEKAQRAIYFTQKELEELISGESSSNYIVCDRGSVDGAAYWPDPSTDFFEVLETSLDAELKRYDWVIHLDTASPENYDTGNSIRTESFSEANDLNEKIKHAWSQHPKRVIIPQQEDFLNKMMAALKVLKLIMKDESPEEIRRQLASF